MKNRKLLVSFMLFAVMGMMALSTMAVPSLNMEGEGTWTSIGPNNAGGRTRALLFDKFNNGVVYAGTVSGLYVSVNNGKNWQEITLGNGAESVTALAQDEYGNLYVGTGEGYYTAALHNEDPSGHANNVSGRIGHGIFKQNSGFNRDWAANLTTDAEKYAYVAEHFAFSQIESTVPASQYDNTDTWAYINTMVYANGTLYVGLKNGGLKYTTDNATFTNIPLDGNNGVVINDLKANADGRVAVTFVNDGGEIALSNTDDVHAFTTIFTASDASLSEDEVLSTIKVDFGKVNQNELYALAANSSADATIGMNGVLNGVYRTDITNVAWSNIAPGTLSNGGTMNYGMSICANDRDEETTIYIGGNSVMAGQDLNGTGVFSWSSLTSAAATDTTGSYVAPNISNILLLPNPSNVYDSLFMIVSTDAGPFTYNYDTIIRVLSWVPSVKGMNTLQSYQIAAAADGSVFAATQANAIVYMPSTSDEGMKAGQKIWSLSSPGYPFYYSTTAGNYADMYMSYSTAGQNGSNVEASAIHRIKPTERKPVILARPNLNVARTYSNGGDYESIDDQTWTYSGSVTQTLMSANLYNNLLYCHNNTPMAFWESFNAANSLDSATVKITDYTTIHRNGDTLSAKDGVEILAGDSILVNSDNLDYPFFHVIENGFEKDGDTVLTVSQPVQARLLLANNHGVYLCSKILDFSRTFSTNPTKDDLAWAKIYQTGRAIDSVSSLNNRTHAVALSADGSAAFIAIDHYSNYYTYENTYLVRVDGLNDINLADAITFNGTAHDTSYFTSTRIGEFTRQISHIECNPANANEMILTFEGYTTSEPNVQYTVNALDASPAFTSLELNPENAAVNQRPVFTALFETMGASNKVFIGAEDGIYSATKGSSSWVKEENIPNIPVYDIWQQTKNLPEFTFMHYTGENAETYKYEATENAGVIYAATYGKGLLMNKTYLQDAPESVSITEVSREDAENTLEVYPNPASDFTTVAYNLTSASEVSFRLYDMNGRELSVVNNGTEAAGFHTMQIDVRGLQAGVYMIKMLNSNTASTAKLIVR